MPKFFRNIFIFSFLTSQLTFGQFYFFGRNKVQYEKFDWKILKTEHFDIYYYNQTEEIAEIGAAYAEEAFDELKVRLNSIVTRRIPLIFYNTHIHFQQTNTTPGFIPEGVGGFFEFIKGRVVIPSMGSLNDFKHVIRHELVHVFMTNKVYRVLADHRQQTGVSPPLWFVEGIAEYMSTDLDAQAEMVMRDAVLNNYFVGIENINRIFGSFLMYKEGQSFLEFVEDKYGEEKIPLMIENMWMNSSFNKVIEYTLGKKLKKIDAEWLYYLREKYYPLISNYAPIDLVTKQVTDFGFNFSPVHYNINNEDYFYFVGNRDGYSSLYRKKLDSEDQPELVIRGEKSEEYESFHLFQSSIDINKNGIITFVTKAGGTDAIHFYSIKDDEEVKTFRAKGLISISSPKFSPDGNKIVFQSVDQKGFSDIFLYDLISDSLTRLTNDYYDDKNPAFGLNNSQIIFSSDRTAGKFEKKYNLFSYNLKTHEIDYITNLNANCFSAILSPNKKKLIFTSDLDGVRNIYEMKIVDGKFSNKVKKVTHFFTSAFDPSFIDSSRIIFSGFDKFAFNIYEMNIKNFSKDSASTDNGIVMQMDSAYGIWEAKKFIAASKKQEVKYEKEYTLDYAAGQVSTAFDPIYGTNGGAIFALSDLLGDDKYFFLIYNTAQVQSEFLRSFNVAIQKVNLSQRTNYGFGVFNFSGRRYDIRESDEAFFERSFGGFFQLNFPLSKFQRIEASITAANSDKEIITGVLERKALLLSNSLSYVLDNSLWGPTGPVDGIRARLLLGYTSDVKFSNVNYFTFIADYRQYFRLGYTTALAFRSAIFYNEGKEARRYFMGGSWDLRGWPRWSIRGEKLWISSLEFRFPLIDQLNIKFPFLNLGFFGIRGAAFFDAGNAWDETYTQTLGSIGAGIRFNLFGVIVLRYDVGKKIENNFSNLQPGLFYQFFFGWDF